MGFFQELFADMITIIIVMVFIVGAIIAIFINLEKKDRAKKHDSRIEQSKLSKDIKSFILSIINAYYVIKRCTNCNDTKFKLIEINGDFTGLRLKCYNCKSKKWTKLESEEGKDFLLKKCVDNPDSEFHGNPNYELVKNSFHILLYRRELEEVYDTSILVESNENEQVKEESINQRHSIPKNIQDRVWKRDEGKCVECGSNENLEFDHIIPVSKGGANTYRNIQLLCEPCNRSKSAKIG